MSGAEKWVEVETPWRLNAGSHAQLGGGEDDRKILGPTPGQDGVDGSFLDGQPTVVRRHLPDQLVARPSGAREHPLHALARRRHDREPVGYAFLEPDLEFVGCCHAAMLSRRDSFDNSERDLR